MEQQKNQQPIQEKAESKHPTKTNWKYIAIVVGFAVLVGGGILLLRGFQQEPLTQQPSTQDTILPQVRKSFVTKEECEEQTGHQCQLVDCDIVDCAYDFEGEGWQSTDIKIEQEKVDTSTWQTYRNDEFGFEVRSPESLPVFVSAEHNTQTIIAVGNADIFGIVVNENSTFAETIQVLKRIWGEELVDAGGKVDFLGLHAFELQTGSEKGASKILVLEHPRKDLVFMIQVAESFFEEGLPDQILSTFRFSP